MDDVLQRMLEVEREAERLVRRAEADADAIRTQGRQALAALVEQSTRETAAAVKALLETRVSEAERLKSDALAAADQDLQQRQAELERRLQPLRDEFVAAVAFPAQAATAPAGARHGSAA